MRDSRELLDDDPAVESLLRQVFTDDAADAPEATDLQALAVAAVRAGRGQRRRAAGVGAALTALVVVAAFVAVDAQRPDSGRNAVPGASAPTSSPQASAGGATGNDITSPALMFRGVEVPVPAAMLDPENVRCGTPIADAAYVVDDTLGVDSCAIPEPPDLTLVVMKPLEDVTQEELAAGGRRLPDGRYLVASAIPGRDVWLTVTSPDRKRADRLFGGAVIADSPKGCDVHPAPAPTVGGPSALPPLSGGAIGRICGYRAGWLTGAALVSGAQLHELFDLVQTAPSDALLDCIAQPPAGDGWWLTLGESKVWVEGTSCARVVVEGGGSARLTDTLASLLWSLAPGPSTLEGVVTDKG